jgi:hypothetical protein
MKAPWWWWAWLVAGLIFWGSVTYVALHFVGKYW